MKYILVKCDVFNWISASESSHAPAAHSPAFHFALNVFSFFLIKLSISFSTFSEQLCRCSICLCHFLRWKNLLPARCWDQQTALEYLFCSNLFSCSICLHWEAPDTTCAEYPPSLLGSEYCLQEFRGDDCIGSGSEDTSGIRLRNVD